MPISNKDLGKYKRPGIFINEIDQSIIELPIQEVLINLIPGFSKKGPFNKPVRVDSPVDFETIYGPLDRNLENKGSYFHRTALDMLQKGPIWGLNLLKTDPNRDLLQWQSFSVASQYDNGPKNSSPYERFFNRQDFWERDVESFMDVVDEEYADNPSTQPDPSKDLFHLTNMGDKKFTVFLFKSSITGFDVTAEDWYGGLDKVPLFMNPKDYISDYMISVLAIGGDWTDYVKLSADPYWSAYFNVRGLIKSKIQDYVNDRLTNVVAYYDVSLIPNFKDTTGLDMYIKNVVNAATEKTGLFCYYNEDALLNADFPKGAVDIIGGTLVGSSKKTLDFMSYKGSISETETYTQKYLDSSGNVFGNYDINMSGSTMDTYSGRTAEYTNWYTNIHDSGETLSYCTKVTSISTDGKDLSCSVNPNTITGDTIYFTKSFGIITAGTPYYVKLADTTFINISTTLDGPALTGIASGTTTNIYYYCTKTKYVDSIGNYKYQIGTTQYQLDPTGHTYVYFSPFTSISSTNTGSTIQRYDIVYLSTDNTSIHVLTGTESVTTATPPNYLLSNENTIILAYYLHTFNGGSATISQSMTGITTNTSGYMNYVGTEDYTISIDTGATSLTLSFVGTKGSTSYSTYSKLRLQKIFAEMETKISLGKSAIINLTNGSKYNIDNNYSIYEATTTTDASIIIYFTTGHTTSEYHDVSKFIIYYIDDEFVLPTGGNPQIHCIKTMTTPIYPLDENVLSPNSGVCAKYSQFYLDFYDGVINNLDWFYKNNDTGETNNIYYMRMYLDTDKNLITHFLLNDPTTTTTTYIENWDTDYDLHLDVHSDRDNLKQTIEIENTSLITDLTNTYSIYVDKTRYSEITKGWYLEAYYDTSYYDSPGEGYLLGAIPRKLVKILSTSSDATYPDYKILTCDGPIKISSNGRYYTTAYKSIDNYFDEYYGITLDPFTIHADSIPNGTDARLDTIMSVIDKSTNLAKGLANKNRITWRYLVDSFGLGLTSKSKQEYVDLCGAKLNCFGFINMPSVRQFKTSVNPNFINDDRTVNTEYIKEGGNPDLNPTFLYSFGDGVGKSTVGYFFPYVKDSNDPTKFIPPAAKVAKAYMAKFTGELGTSYPWQIIAGPQFSRIPDISSTEMRFTNEDLENFYSMGANPIVYTLNRGYNINSENTAQVYPISSLSYIHSREVLIELENRLYDMLLNYHWRFNTPEIRAEIKFRADQICKELLDTNALYDFKNVCDKTNNTDYLIDLQIGVLDTYIEIIKGMGIIVNNITILKKGTIQSGGFIPVA